MSTLASATEKMAAALAGIPTRWGGQKSILEMKAGGSRHWRQMEWIGFYFEFLCAMHLQGIVRIPGPRYGRTGFDGFYECPWDFKAHANNTSSHEVIVNDTDAITCGIKEYGCVGLILAVGTVLYNDADRTFQAWHEALKGGKSKYEIARIERGAWSRLRKVGFDLQQVSFIQLTRETLEKAGSFQGNFRNSNARPRRTKVLLDLECVGKDLVLVREFG